MTEYDWSDVDDEELDDELDEDAEAALAGFDDPESLDIEAEDDDDDL